MADWDIRPSDPHPDAEVPRREAPAESTLRRSRMIVKVLRAVAVGAVVAGVIAQFGVTYLDDERFGTGSSGSTKFYNFLQGLWFPFIWGGLVLAASAAVDIMATRLAAERSNIGGDPPRRVDAAGDLIVNAPGRPLLSHEPESTAVPPIDDAIWQPPIPAD